MTRLIDAPTQLAAIALTGCADEPDAVLSLLTAAEVVLIRMHDKVHSRKPSSAGEAVGRDQDCREIEQFMARLQDMRRAVPKG